MKRSGQIFGIVGILVVCLFFGVNVFAQEGETPDTTARQDWKQDFAADQQQLQEQREAIKGDAQAAKDEEKVLVEQIKQAEQAGDFETAKSLRQQLKATHKENMGQKQQNQQSLKSARQEVTSDKKEARQEGYLPPKKDLDNNPPGPKGGPGTNWENQPGPQGGPGASPDRKSRIDRDNNPPGKKGGPGTNWENKPGPQGGAGASPNRKPKK